MPGGVAGEAPVMAVEPRARDQSGQSVEELEGPKAEGGEAFTGRAGQGVDEAHVVGSQGAVRRGVAQPVLICSARPGGYSLSGHNGH